MGTMIVRLRTLDFFEWQKVFNATGYIRASAGLSNERIYRGTHDGNDLVLVIKVADMETAKRFASSPLRKQICERCGVVGIPRDLFIDEDGWGEVVLGELGSSDGE